MVLPTRNRITIGELERIAICMMQWKTPDGKLTTWGSDIIASMIEQSKTGSVTLEIVTTIESEGETLPLQE